MCAGSGSSGNAWRSHSKFLSYKLDNRRLMWITHDVVSTVEVVGVVVRVSWRAYYTFCSVVQRATFWNKQQTVQVWSTFYMTRLEQL